MLDIMYEVPSRSRHQGGRDQRGRSSRRASSRCSSTRRGWPQAASGQLSRASSEVVACATTLRRRGSGGRSWVARCRCCSSRRWSWTIAARPGELSLGDGRPPLSTATITSVGATDHRVRCRRRSLGQRHRRHRAPRSPSPSALAAPAPRAGRRSHCRSRRRIADRRRSWTVRPRLADAERLLRSSATDVRPLTSDERKGPSPGPLLPLRDIIVFPHMVVPLFVGREKSISALEEAMAPGSDKEILLSAQQQRQDQRPDRPTTSSRSARSARSSSCCACPTAR